MFIELLNKIKDYDILLSSPIWTFPSFPNKIEEFLSIPFCYFGLPNMISTGLLSSVLLSSVLMMNLTSPINTINDDYYYSWANGFTLGEISTNIGILGDNLYLILFWILQIVLSVTFFLRGVRETEDSGKISRIFLKGAAIYALVNITIVYYLTSNLFIIFILESFFISTCMAQLISGYIKANSKRFRPVCYIPHEKLNIGNRKKLNVDFILPNRSLPFANLAYRTAKESWTESFPSGDACQSGICTGIISYVFALLIPVTESRVILYTISITWFSLFFLSCFGRLYLGAHHLSDVLVGGTIGYYTANQLVCPTIALFYSDPLRLHELCIVIVVFAIVLKFIKRGDHK